MATLDRALIETEKQLMSAQSRIKKAALDHKKQIDRGMEYASATGASLISGYVEGRFPERSKVAGIELSIVAGAALAVAGVMELAGAHSNLVGAAGLGSLCYGAGSRGRKMGEDAKAKAK
jgi:hypothetical protein